MIVIILRKLQKRSLIHFFEDFTLFFNLSQLKFLTFQTYAAEVQMDYFHSFDR